VIKVFLVPEQIEKQYPFNSDWTPLTADVVELAQRPYFRELFEKPFTTYLLVVTPLAGRVQFIDGLSREEADLERDQLYRLAKHLLTTYANTGKTFILQNWEGDHLLYQGLQGGAQPDAVRVRGMIDWWRVRQEGVRQARLEVGTHGVDVLHAAEVNFLRAAMAGKVTATNDVLPSIDADLYSYSSWDVGFDPAELVRALDYLAAKAPPSGRFGDRDVYLGEFGVAKGQGVPEGERAERIRLLTEAALGWGVRYAIYWEVYCNEALRNYRGRPRNGDLRGFWLVRPDGVRARMWDDFAAQVPAGLYRATFRSFTGQYFAVASPGDRALRAERWTRGDSWATFAFKDWNGGELQNGDEVSLQAHDGGYLSLEKGAKARILAQVNNAGKNERFILRKIEGGGPIRPGDSIALQARNGRFLGAEVGGRGAIRALRSILGPAEVFTFSPLDE
jgi:hypothetical protein